MARVTVEDCLENVENRFELVLVGAKRSRQLANGVEAFIDWENDKPTVVALREIAAGRIGPQILQRAEAEEGGEALGLSGFSAADVDAEVGGGLRMPDPTASEERELGSSGEEPPAPSEGEGED